MCVRFGSLADISLRSLENYVGPPTVNFAHLAAWRERRRSDYRHVAWLRGCDRFSAIHS
jgi:hypothetical protein